MESLWSPDSLLGWIKNMSLHWEVPVFSASVYIVWVLRNNKRIKEKMEKKEILKPQNTASGSSKSKQASPKKKKSFQLKSMIFLHNMGMSLFSMLVFKKTFDVVWTGLWSLSFSDFIVDPGRKMERQLSPWIWIFYISKYYEVVDTLILFLSNKESSFLQMYHHAGAIVACWLVSLSESYTGWIWVGLNSFIHSAMYLYYAMTVIGIRPPFKRVITFMQITQFFVGLFFGVVYMANPSCFSPDPVIRFYQYSAIAFNIIYVIILIGLFINFERQTYRKSSAPKEAVVQKEAAAASITSITSHSSSTVLSPS
ncbi:hypothetical protein NEMIN01_0736 [Nematocida minor]|uniref:uncharacterized protein n=1 Tax=Nematocida minor TaxID=1912983 RepID=UPI002220F664|nr:uncharacterized protein NEMIN01_0736 [Nematocida minor]KAI5189873.1 hypothetical protein NEMIN01_0736 [Nematocida minor]